MKDKIFIEIDKNSLEKFERLCSSRDISPQDLIEEYVDHIIEQNPGIYAMKKNDGKKDEEKKELSIKIDARKVDELREYCKTRNLTVQTVIEGFIESQISSMDIA